MGSNPTKSVIKRKEKSMANKSKLYSETMREFSNLDEDSLKLYQMRYGLIPIDKVLIDQVGYSAFMDIPSCTPIQKNAMLQIMASFDDSYERKEWADRIEGKTTQTNVNVNHDTSNSIDDLEKYTLSKLDEILGGN